MPEGMEGLEARGLPQRDEDLHWRVAAGDPVLELECWTLDSPNSHGFRNVSISAFLQLCVVCMQGVCIGVCA